MLMWSGRGNARQAVREMGDVMENFRFVREKRGFSSARGTGIEGVSLYSNTESASARAFFPVHEAIQALEELAAVLGKKVVDGPVPPTLFNEVFEFKGLDGSDNDGWISERFCIMRNGACWWNAWALSADGGHPPWFTDDLEAPVFTGKTAQEAADIIQAEIQSFADIAIGLGAEVRK